MKQLHTLKGIGHKKALAIIEYRKEHNFTKIENIIGTHGKDIIYGNDKRNIFKGQEGTDTIKGEGGDDLIFGG